MKNLIALICLLTFSYSLTAQNNILKGKHSIYFEGGFKTNSQTSVVTVFNTVETKTGFIGSLNYGYFWDEEWALNFSAGIFGAEANTKYNNTEVNGIASVLFGIRYYPANLSLGDIGRVYIGSSIGQFIGFATKTKNLFSTENLSESVLGAQIIVGFDWYIASWFKIGPSFSYYLMEDFKKVIGTENNMSGGGFSFDFGFLF